MDNIYIPIKRRFVYLACIVYWFARWVLAWRLSITLEVNVCIEVVKEPLAGHDKPNIFNTYQGSRLTSIAFAQVLKDADIAISMEGQKAWHDNVFVARLWHTNKYEEIYLHAYSNVPENCAAIGTFLGFYYYTRPHYSLDGQTPDQAYFMHFSQYRWSQNKGRAHL